MEGYKKELIVRTFEKHGINFGEKMGAYGNYVDSDFEGVCDAIEEICEVYHKNKMKAISK